MQFLELWRAYGTVVNGGLLLGILTILLKTWIQSRRVRIEEKRDDRDGYGKLIQALETRIDQCEEDAATAREAAAQAKETVLALKAIVLRFHSLVHLLQTELEQGDPENEVLRNARGMLQQLYRDIEMIPGTVIEPLQTKPRRI
jgi:chromosome segregation ATPase